MNKVKGDDRLRVAQPNVDVHVVKVILLLSFFQELAKVFLGLVSWYAMLPSDIPAKL